jgi:hypothetical protein
VQAGQMREIGISETNHLIVGPVGETITEIQTEKKIKKIFIYISFFLVFYSFAL